MPHIPFDRLEPRKLSSTKSIKTKVWLDENLISLLHILLCENEEEGIFDKIMEIITRP
jgi:hypothetical protein